MSNVCFAKRIFKFRKVISCAYPIMWGKFKGFIQIIRASAISKAAGYSIFAMINPLLVIKQFIDLNYAPYPSLLSLTCTIWLWYLFFDNLVLFVLILLFFLVTVYLTTVLCFLVSSFFTQVTTIYIYFCFFFRLLLPYWHNNTLMPFFWQLLYMVHILYRFQNYLTGCVIIHLLQKKFII